MPWEWARPRLMPLLAGPYLGHDPFVTVVGEPGCAVIFGVEIQRTFVLVDRPVAERWETSDDQRDAVARQNLDRRAARLEAADLIHGTLSGRIVRILERVAWSSSLVLAPKHLVRLFGGDDQIIGTPRRETIIAASIDTPTSVFAHILVDYEYKAAYPLLLDPFLLEEGKLSWQSDDEDRAWTS